MLLKFFFGNSPSKSNENKYDVVVPTCIFYLVQVIIQKIRMKKTLE